MLKYGIVSVETVFYLKKHYFVVFLRSHHRVYGQTGTMYQRRTDHRLLFRGYLWSDGLTIAISASTTDYNCLFMLYYDFMTDVDPGMFALAATLQSPPLSSAEVCSIRVY